ncbi:unnamed protein product [Symbiodinium sp. CCMP2592]|nr:unnamed protein product [Symbiodinium sp. CCMP2592]
MPEGLLESQQRAKSIDPEVLFLTNMGRVVAKIVSSAIENAEDLTRKWIDNNSRSFSLVIHIGPLRRILLQPMKWSRMMIMRQSRWMSRMRLFVSQMIYVLQLSKNE